MDTTTSGSTAPEERHYTLQQVMQIVWLSHQFPANVDFHDPRMAAELLITNTVMDVAAAVKNYLEAIALTYILRVVEIIKGTTPSPLGAQSSEGTNETTQTTLDPAPKHRTSRTANEPQVPDLNPQLLTLWSNEFQSTVEKHKFQGNICRETVVTMTQFKALAEMLLNLIGKDGHKNFKQCLWAKRHFDDSVWHLSGTLEASRSVEDRVRALRLFLEVYPLNLLAGDAQKRLGTPDSDEPCKQASQTLRKSRMNRAEALRHELLAITWFSEQCDAYTEKLKDRSQPSPELEWLKQYSEARGRYTRQGVGYQSLFIDYLVDHSNPNSASFTPEMINTTKVQLRNTQSDGRRLSNLYRRFGPGIFCYITIQTKTALKNVKGDQLTKVLVAFLEATAATIPSLQEIFHYSNDAMTSSSSSALELATPFRKLLSDINRNPDHALESIKGADVLNTEFEYHYAKSQNGGNVRASDAARSLLDQQGETGDDDGHGNGNRPEANVEEKTNQDEDKDDTSEHERAGKTESPEHWQMINRYMRDVPDDDDNNLNDDDEDEGCEPQHPAKRQKLGSFPFHTARLS